MKLTWFGTSVLRIYIGGKIVVVDPERAGPGIDRVELTAGAETVLALHDDLAATVDPGAWRPRKPGRFMDEGDEGPGLEVFRAGADCLVVEVPGEPPLVLVGETVPAFGRWVDGAVVVLFAAQNEAGAALLEAAKPKLVALAGDDGAVDRAFDALVPVLDGVGLVVLEKGMALEV